MKKIILLVLFFYSGNLLKSQTTQFYGPAYNGGIYGGGAVFSVDGSGNNYQKKHDFLFSVGASGLCEGSNGKICGGTNTNGIYEYDVTTNILYEKYKFSFANVSIGPMLNAPNNKMYGVSSGGGTYDKGFLFEYDYINNIVVIKYHFDGPINGGAPNGKLILASNGKMYGTTSAGANVQNEGSIFEFDYLTSTFTKKTDFYSGAGGPGAQPGKYLAEGTNNKIYGTCSSSSTLGGGTIFEYDPSNGNLVSVYDFHSGFPDAYYPSSGLTKAINGKLYGTTYTGGVNGYGGIFEFNYNTATYTDKVDFPHNMGDQSTSCPININNKLYVFTTAGGPTNYGTYVAYDLGTSSLSLLHTFTATGATQPGQSIIKHSNGKLYSITGGGIAAQGVFVQVDTLGTVNELLNLGTSTEGNDPNELTYVYGNLYGTCQTGGTYNQGTIFKYDPIAQQYTKLYEFDNFGNGNYPSGSFIPSTGTSLYGVTLYGGATSDGQLYEFDVNLSTFTPLTDLDNNTLGSSPTGFICKHANGKLYFPCNFGGASSMGGTLVEYDPSNGNTVKRYDFANTANGSNPEGIMVASNGKIYGVAKTGGANSNGVIFEFTPPSTYVKKYTFNASASGDYPIGRHLEVSPGILYGLTQNGGTHGNGVLYKYIISSNTFQKLIDFDSTINGNHPNCSLTLGTGGKIYGTTTKGGINDQGILFVYDTLTNTLTKKLDFNGQNGSVPGTLTLVCGITSYDAGNNASLCKNGNVVLGTTPDAGYSYSWSPVTGLSGATTPNPTLTVQSSPVTYTVTESYLGCIATDQITITPLIPQTPDICLVTDDSTSLYNHIVWDKTLYTGVDSFIMYREVSTGIYSRIGAVSKNSLSDFTDVNRSVGPANGDPNISTYRYKISIKDTCGNEGAMSPYHTSVYFNDLHTGSFTWNTYSIEGNPVTPVTTFDLLRDDNNTGAWHVIGSCAGTANLLNDPLYGTYQLQANWRVYANGFNCVPTMKLGNNSTQTAVVKAKSNITNNRAMGVRSVSDNEISIYPNPTNSMLTLKIHDEPGTITIYNSLGEMVLKTKGRDPIDVSTLSNGVYILEVQGKHLYFVKE